METHYHETRRNPPRSLLLILVTTEPLSVANYLSLLTIPDKRIFLRLFFPSRDFSRSKIYLDILFYIVRVIG